MPVGASPFRRIWWSRKTTPSDVATFPFECADFHPTLRTGLLILQPTPFCNIDCDYCYLPNRNNKARLAVSTVDVAVRRLIDDGLIGPNLSVVWHAGEPTVLQPAYYEDAFAAIAEAVPDGCKVTHCLQTNATLLDQAWCALFLRHRVRVGVSIDGPPLLHDAHRRTRQGKGTHAAVMRGVAALREAGVRFHAIAVVTSATLDQPEAFADFFESLGVAEVGCNFDEAEGGHAGSSLADREVSHFAFLRALAEHCSRPGNRLVVRELVRARQLVLEPLPEQRWRGHCWPVNAQVMPFAMVNVAHDGRFSTFSPELIDQPAPAYGDFVFGNVADVGYLEATSSDNFQRVWSEIVRGVLACERDCAHFTYCGGGAPANKYYELGDFGGTETLYCRSMVKRPFVVALEHAERWLQSCERAGVA
jgi:uncharacterized protein